MATLSIRIDFSTTGRLGPGKIELLERVAELGSISAAGRSMRMSYRRAWRLIDELNHAFGRPLVEAQIGGKLAQLGQRLVNGSAKKLADEFFANFAKAVQG